MECDEQKNLEVIHDTLQSEGWARIVEDLEAKRKLLLDVRNITTEQELFFTRGQVQAIDSVLMLQSFVKDRLDV